MKRHQAVRRELLLGGAATGLLAGLGCSGATAAPLIDPGMRDAERLRVTSGAGPLPVVQRGDEVLRRRASAMTEADLEQLRQLDQRMRATLEVRGVGLAAPQIDVSVRAILVMLGARGDAPRVELFVNPRIVDRSDDVELDYEGCLSVADVCGLVRRNRKVVVEHAVPGAPPKRLQVAGFDARIFQHEIDHLDGVLYVDRVEGGLQPMEQLKELREKLRADQRQALLPPAFERRRVLL